MTRRSDDGGVILVNVLLALAIGAAVVTLMLVSQRGLLERGSRAAAGAQARALALGAEMSLVVALRRDMRDAPEADHLAEPWAEAAQARVDLATGSFSVEIADAQARFDLNALTAPGLADRESFLRLTRALSLPDAVAATVVDEVRRHGPIDHLSELRGVDPTALVILAPHVTALPVPGRVNVNTAGPLVLAAVLRNSAAAQRLVSLRDRTGSLTRADLADAGVLAAGTAGFTSQVWDITVTAEVGGVEVALRSRLVRRSGPGVLEVAVVSRSWSGCDVCLPKSA